MSASSDFHSQPVESGSTVKARLRTFDRHYPPVVDPPWQPAPAALGRYIVGWRLPHPLVIPLQWIVDPRRHLPDTKDWAFIAGWDHLPRLMLCVFTCVTNNRASCSDILLFVDVDDLLALTTVTADMNVSSSDVRRRLPTNPLAESFFCSEMYASGECSSLLLLSSNHLSFL